jgi:methylated-DNA-[protein]-cysteine S-methyltransferase
MTARAFSLFETPIGHCGVVWGPGGVAGVQLPEPYQGLTRQRLLRRFPDAYETLPPPVIAAAINAIVALLGGEASDLSAIVLDTQDLSPFDRQVYAIARSIAPGATLSYGEIATRLGDPTSARAVGKALARNPFALVVPCHRVLAAGGKLGGFSANGGVATKRRLLAIEAALTPAQDQLPLLTGASGFDFDPAIAVARLRTADPILARLIDTVGPFRMELKSASNLFGVLAEAIVYQQLHGKAAATIFARVCALVPRRKSGLSAEQIVEASDEQLRGAGLSRQKLLALRDLAQRTRAGEIPTLREAQGMDDEILIERLTQVRGVGRWTVQMLLMLRLGRPDILAVDDYGLRKGYAVAFRKVQLPTREQLAKRAARWKPYRSVASWYLWRAAELSK